MSRGFSLIELMISMAVLAVGILGGIVVIAMATANNGRSKWHTTSEMMAQSVMEKIVAIPESATGTAAQTTLTDCAGNTFTIETGLPANATAAGAPLINNGAFSGSVDFSQPPQPNYSMVYVTCATGAAGIPYDVRWNIQKGPTLATQIVTVSAKVSGNAGPAAQLTLPFTLHQLRGDF